MAGLFSSPEDLSEKERFYKRMQSERDDITAGMLGWRGLFTDWEEKTNYGGEDAPLGTMSFDRTMNEYQKESNITNAYIDQFGLPKTEADLDKFTETLRTYGANTMADRVVNARMQNAMSDIFSGIKAGGGKGKEGPSPQSLKGAFGSTADILEGLQTTANIGEYFDDSFDTEQAIPQLNKALESLQKTKGLGEAEARNILQSGVKRDTTWYGREYLNFDYNKFLEELRNRGYNGAAQKSSGGSSLVKEPVVKPW